MGDRIEFGNGFVLEGSNIKNDKGELLTEEDLREIFRKRKLKEAEDEMVQMQEGEDK